MRRYDFGLLSNLQVGASGAAAVAHCLAAHGVPFKQCWDFIDNFKLTDLIAVIQAVEPFLASMPALDKVVQCIEAGLIALANNQPVPVPSPEG